MPSSDRNWNRGEHPPTCTCVDCVNKRLGIYQQNYNTSHQNTNNQSTANKKQTPHKTQNAKLKFLNGYYLYCLFSLR
jgi:hypothetical protein